MADSVVFHVETAWKGNETEAGLVTEGQTVAYQGLTSPFLLLLREQRDKVRVFVTHSSRTLRL